MFLILMTKVEVGESWNRSLEKISTLANGLQRKHPRGRDGGFGRLV